VSSGCERASLLRPLARSFVPGLLPVRLNRESFTPVVVVVTGIEYFRAVGGDLQSHDRERYYVVSRTSTDGIDGERRACQSSHGRLPIAIRRCRPPDADDSDDSQAKCSARSKGDGRDA
jgi:hypothetical protein